MYTIQIADKFNYNVEFKLLHEIELNKISAILVQDEIILFL